MAKAFVKRLQDFSMKKNPYIKLFVSLYPGMAAVLLAFFKDPIVSSTSLAAKVMQHKAAGIPHTVNIWVFLYWMSLVFWVICYFTFITNESSTNKKTTQSIKSAIFRAPNAKIFVEYEICYKQIMQQLGKINTDEILKHDANLVAILQTICVLTSTYINQKDSKEIYGANIMLYFPYELNKQRITKWKTQHEWLHFRKTDLDIFNGVLHLIPTLVYKSKDGINAVQNPTMKSICLPVITEDHGTDLGILNIPGAPMAAIDGQFLFSNTKSTKAYAHLGTVEEDHAEQYWANELPEINSVMSFGIPFSWPSNLGQTKPIHNVIGVINIDSTKQDILGTDKEYHPTYIALLYPILCQLAPILYKYYVEYSETNNV